jgi:WD40-like Beta Propeller Repeat
LTSRHAHRTFVVLIFALLARTLAAQSPAAEWRTIATPHFRVHYTAGAAGWAERAASRLESVRSAVVKEVGFAPETVTDVLVMNPIADPNGLTLPLLRAPRIVYFTEPPDPESTIGEYSDWIDLLAVHETTHLVHLMRPSRNPGQRLLERILPLNPITLDAPRWVLEGYATVVEGRITGSGRPNSALRAAILRKWAISGRLPSYGQLDSGHQFLGMSMAYLAGSAYLEWLERRSGGDALRHLWARMTARQRRSFDAAFSSVFGESPSRLYGQFVADLTESSMTAAEESAKFTEGPLWQETTYESGDPAVSPDGTRLAMVTRNDKGESKLVVFGTGTNEEEAKLAKRIEAILKRDPEDVAPVRAKPLPRKPLFTLEVGDGGDIETPRWTADGASLIYTHRQPDRDGFLHRDLFRWTPADGRVERLTRLADVHDAEPLDAGHAVAVRNRGGASQLVIVDLSSGAVADRTPPSLEIVYARPRVGRDGRLAWSQHDHGGWHVVVDGRDAGPRGTFDPEWGSDGTLYAVRAKNGFLDVVRLVNGDAFIVAHAVGALEAPAAAPDGALYFMSLEPDGFVVRRLAAPVPSEHEAAAPATTPSTFATFESQPLPPSLPYGIGRQEVSPFFGVQNARGFHALEVGARIGDVVGRLDTLIIASAGDLRGAAVASRWRGWPVNVAVHAFTVRGDHGVELRGSYSDHGPGRVFRVDSGTLLGDHSVVFADTSFRLSQRNVAAEELRLAGDSRHHARATLRLAGRAGGLTGALTLTGARRDITLGGLPTSIIPDSRNIGRVFDPTLAGLAGRDYRGARVEVASGAITWFIQQHRLDGETTRVAGAAVMLHSDFEPLAQFAALDLTAGVARVIDEHRTRAWIGMRWRQ